MSLLEPAVQSAPNQVVRMCERNQNGWLMMFRHRRTKKIETNDADWTLYNPMAKTSVPGECYDRKKSKVKQTHSSVKPQVPFNKKTAFLAGSHTCKTHRSHSIACISIFTYIYHKKKPFMYVYIYIYHTWMVWEIFRFLSTPWTG